MLWKITRIRNNLLSQINLMNFLHAHNQMLIYSGCLNKILIDMERECFLMVVFVICSQLGLNPYFANCSYMILGKLINSSKSLVSH